MVETKKEEAVDNPLCPGPIAGFIPERTSKKRISKENVNLEFRISAFLSPTGDAPCGMRWNGTPGARTTNCPLSMKREEEKKKKRMHMHMHKRRVAEQDDDKK